MVGREATGCEVERVVNSSAITGWYQDSLLGRGVEGAVGDFHCCCEYNWSFEGHGECKPSCT